MILQKLTDSLLEMEEEKAIWSAKEKAAVQAIEEKARLNNAQTMSLSKELLDVRFIFLPFKKHSFVYFDFFKYFIRA